MCVHDHCPGLWMLKTDLTWPTHCKHIIECMVILPVDFVLENLPHSNCKMSSTGSLNMVMDLPSSLALKEVGPEVPLQQQANFDLKHGRIDPSPWTARSVFKSLSKKCAVSRKCLLMSFLQLVPLVNFIKTYKLREDVLGDVVSGLTVGIMTVPQSMAYAILASVPPIVGLYTSIFPVFAHLIFGTSPYAGMGMMALSSLLTGTAVRRETAHLEEQLLSALSNDTAELQEQLHEEQIAVATTLALMSGVIALVMACFRLGFVTSYLSSALIAGYFASVNVTVLTHQVRLILGVPVGTYSGPLSYWYMVWDMMCNLKQTNVAQLLMSIVCCLILILVKKCVNERFKARLRVPVPIELIVIILATVISHFGDFEDEFGVEIVGHIPKGIPAPVVPRLGGCLSLLADSITMAILCYLMMFLMANMLGERHNLELHPNQDLYALSMCNVVGSFFSCIAASSSPPRSLIMESTGGRTQLAFGVSSIVVLLFLFALAPLLESLPVCILASLIIVACIPLFQYYRASLQYWRSSKYDFAVYIITTIGVLFWNITAGLVVGITTSFFLVVFRTQQPYMTTLAFSSDREILLDCERYSRVREIPKIKVFRFESPLYFPTLDLFKKKLYSVAIKPANLKQGQKGKIPEVAKEDVEAAPAANGASDAEGVLNPSTSEDQNQTKAAAVPFIGRDNNDELKFLIIDCSGIPFADTAGVRSLISLHADYGAVGVTMLLAGCTETVRDMLYRLPECQSLATEALYVSAQDAVKWALNET